MKIDIRIESASNGFFGRAVVVEDGPTGYEPAHFLRIFADVLTRSIQLGAMGPEIRLKRSDLQFPDAEIDFVANAMLSRVRLLQIFADAAEPYGVVIHG